MEKLIFGNCHELLSRLGYAPAPIGESGQPLGPFAVMQIAYRKHHQNDPLPCAVLTRPAMLQGPPPPDAGLLDNEQVIAARLVLVKVADATEAVIAGLDELLPDVPVRVDASGERIYVYGQRGEFPVFGTLLSTAQTGGPQAHIVHGPGFVPLSGAWPRGTLLERHRRELPELDITAADALVKRLDKLLAKHAPKVKPAPPAPRAPTLTEQLAQGVTVAAAVAHDAIQRNGYYPACVDGDGRVALNYREDYRGQVVWARESWGKPAGIFLSDSRHEREAVAVEIAGDLADIADAVLVQCMGAGLLRIGMGGRHVRLYRASRHDPARDPGLAARPDLGPYVMRISCRRPDNGFAHATLTFLTGCLQVGGYTWPSGSPVDTGYDDLPEIAGSRLPWVKREIEAALQPAAA